jgi:hypothetical protein
MSAPTPPTPTLRQQQIVMWVLWFAFLNGIILFRVFLAQPPPGGKPLPADAFPWALSLFPVLLSGVIRWTLLPRARDPQQSLVLMVVGIAFAEATSFFGIFLTPSHLNLLCGASFLGVFQFAPTWAARFFPAEEVRPTQNVIPRPPQ